MCTHRGTQFDVEGKDGDQVYQHDERCGVVAFSLPELLCPVRPGKSTINEMGVKTERFILNSGFKTCFAPAAKGAGCKTHLKSRFFGAILKKWARGYSL